MFENIGQKIMSVAKIYAYIGIIGCTIIGLIISCINVEFIITGLLIVILGSFFSWVNALVLYGFGTLIENSNTLVKQPTFTHASSKENDDKIETLKKWRARNLITEEEYNEKLKEMENIY